MTIDIKEICVSDTLGYNFMPMDQSALDELDNKYLINLDKYKEDKSFGNATIIRIRLRKDSYNDSYSFQGQNAIKMTLDVATSNLINIIRILSSILLNNTTIDFTIIDTEKKKTKHTLIRIEIDKDIIYYMLVNNTLTHFNKSCMYKMVHGPENLSSETRDLFWKFFVRDTFLTKTKTFLSKFLVKEFIMGEKLVHYYQINEAEMGYLYTTTRNDLFEMFRLRDESIDFLRKLIVRT